MMWLGLVLLQAAGAFVAGVIASAAGATVTGGAWWATLAGTHVATLVFGHIVARQALADLARRGSS